MAILEQLALRRKTFETCFTIPDQLTAEEGLAGNSLKYHALIW